MAESQARGEGVAGRQCRHAVFADEPGRGDERAYQSTGKHTAGLERAHTQNFMRMRGVIAPVVHDVENFCTHNSAEDDQNTKVPRIVGVNSLFGRVADADPKTGQNAQRDQEAIGRYIEIAVMEESGEHYSIRCKIPGN